MAEKKLPPPITEGDDRIKQRPYESAFAQLPADEVHVRPRPGDGPAGGLDDGPRNLPLMLVVLGFVVWLLTFVVAHWLVLLAGLALVLAGFVWGLVRARPLRLWKGVGTVRVRER